MDDRKSDSIFPFPTRKFKRYWIFVFKKISPITPHSLGVLKDIWKRSDCFKSLQFFIAHIQAKIRLTLN